MTFLLILCFPPVLLKADVVAKRMKGKTQWIRIESLAGEPCKIKPFIEGEISIHKNGKTEQFNVNKDDIIDVELKEGEEAFIYAGNKVHDFTISPVHINENEYNFWGVKAK